MNIMINQDDIVEYNETFNVVLAENSSRLAIIPGRNVTLIIITEDNDCKSKTNVTLIVKLIKSKTYYAINNRCEYWFSKH